MKKIFTLVLLFATSAFAAIPEPTGDFVNDYADILTSEQETALRDKLVKFNKDTGNNLVFVSVAGLEGQTIEDWSMSLAEKWKVGKKGKDNGVLYIVAPNDRKSRIEVGYGLEGKLPDGKTALINKQANPLFKLKQFNTGINIVIDGLIVAATEAPEVSAPAEAATPSATPNKNPSKHPIVILVSFLGLFFVCLVYFIFNEERKRKKQMDTYQTYSPPFIPPQPASYKNEKRSKPSYSSPPPIIPISTPSYTPKKRESSRRSSSSSSYDFGSSSSSSSSSSSDSSFDSGGSFGGGGSSDSW